MNFPPGPARLLGNLFPAVQEGGLFPDSKTFADAVPRRPVADILADWAAAEVHSGPALRAFVAANFELPGEPDTAAPDGLPLLRHIVSLWDVLTRTPLSACPDGSLIPLPHPYVVPGGRFRELYYWDSYFTMLGLARSGRQDLVEQMILNFGSLLDRFGHIPNGTRTYYLSRSHPPFFHLMAALSRNDADRRRRLEWMRIEHRFWMDGADGLAPGGEHRRVVRLADGALLNRYWDDEDTPRDESWREDVALAARTDRPAADVWRDLRAAAESGWDFSSRWLTDGGTLATIRTTRLVPIDLNCLLHGLEAAIAGEAAVLGEDAIATAFADHADRRARAIGTHMWSAAAGHYGDFDIDAAHVSSQLTAAALFPLFAGIADPARARATAHAVRPLAQPGGLMTTLSATGEQWDAPNGWAPLQWIAIVGLRRYGENRLADAIAANWLSMVETVFAGTGQMLEKYDVRRRTGGGGGEYGNEIGFGWTNGVTLALHSPAGSAVA